MLAFFSLPLRRCCLSRGQGQTVLRYLRAALYLFNVHTLLLALCGCLAVYCCDKWRLSFNMDFTLVATGTTFPLVFTIQQAFTRRERALSLIANLKASAVGLYYMHRDWCQDENFPASMGNDHNTAALQCKLLLVELLREVRAYLLAESVYESCAEQRLAAKRHEAQALLLADMSLSGASQLSFAVALEKAEKLDPAAAALRRCYRCFSRLSVLNERLGLRAGYTKGGEGGMSRTNQYLRYIISNLEELRYIKEYRTPIMMRAAHGVLLHLFAVIFAPYFVHFCDSWTALGYDRASCPAGYTASIIYCLIVMLLFNTQQDLENPFDMHGLDDIFFDLGREMDDAWQPLASMAATPSGYASPRHFNNVNQDTGTCSSPNPRCHADLAWPQPPPWVQAKMAGATTSISRRGSALGTVTEEDSLIGVGQQAAGAEEQPTAQTAAGEPSTHLAQHDAGASAAAAAAPSPRPCSGDGTCHSTVSVQPHRTDLHVTLPLHQNQRCQSPGRSPRNSGAGLGSSLRPMSPSAAALTAAAGAGNMGLISGGFRQRSPFERQSRAGSSVEHLPQGSARCSCCPGSSRGCSDSDESVEQDSTGSNSQQHLMRGEDRSDADLS